MKLALCGALIAASLACAEAQTAPAAQPSSSPNQDAIVAEIGGRKITLRELDERWQAIDPAERARVTQLLYQHRRNTLDQMMGDLLIEDAAKTAGQPVEEFVKQETTKRLTAVTDAEVAQFFEANKDRTQGRTLEQLQEPIRNFLAGQKQAQAKAQLVDDLRNKAANLRVLLEPPRQSIEVAAHDPVRGAATAPITIVEYSDYQCPFCARVNPTLDKVRATYGDKVRIVFKDFPLPNHKEAPKAAEAAHCAGDQGKYWEMHDRLFGNQQQLVIPVLKQHAVDLKLDAAAFGECLDSGKHTMRVTESMRIGEQMGVQSTPTLYVNGRPVIGAQPFEYFQSVIDEELRRK
jgi:protein-disulfide isomerase